MGNEGHSREAFDKNEEKIDDARELARENAFGGRAEPGDIMSAKFSYMAGKQASGVIIQLW